MELSASSSGSSTQTNSTSSADRKVLADLEILLERLRRGDELLREHHTVDHVTTPALLSVVGFLEASAPRMVELVEVAAQGAVSDAVLMKCLEVNDRLTKVLAEIDATPFHGDNDTAASGGTDEANDVLPAIGTTKSEDEFDAFLNDRVQTTAPATDDGGLL